jgi:predicted nucleotidyltransferase
MKITDYAFYTKLTQQPFVEQIWLFGSRARGDNQDRADIDIAIYCPTATAKDWLKILNIIDDADTLLKIDCLRLDGMDDDSAIKQAIEREGVKLYEKR